MERLEATPIVASRTRSSRSCCASQECLLERTPPRDHNANEDTDRDAEDDLINVKKGDSEPPQLAAGCGPAGGITMASNSMTSCLEEDVRTRFRQGRRTKSSVGVEGERKPQQNDPFLPDVDFSVIDCRESARLLASRVWQVVPHYALPTWLQDNDFLLRGHRPQLKSFLACFQSIFRVHTETGNIWTHLVGAWIFIGITIYFLVRQSVHMPLIEKVVFCTFFAGAIICLSFSWLFHTVSCHSPLVSYVFSKMDYCGIAILTMGSFVPWLYYGFYCQTFTKVVYLVGILLLGSTAIVVSLWDKFSAPEYRNLRAGLFIGLGLSGVIPAVHYSIKEGLIKAFTDGALGWLLLMAALYIGGALLYANRIPERWFPGYFDIWFQSHQIFHVCVVAAAFVHYHGICLLSAHRLSNGDCSLPELPDLPDLPDLPELPDAFRT